MASHVPQPPPPQELQYTSLRVLWVSFLVWFPFGGPLACHSCAPWVSSPWFRRGLVNQGHLYSSGLGRGQGARDLFNQPAWQEPLPWSTHPFLDINPGVFCQGLALNSWVGPSGLVQKCRTMPDVVESLDTAGAAGGGEMAQRLRACTILAEFGSSTQAGLSQHLSL